ncbi:MAG: hypothetical protein VX836_02835 [Pseudomonadota bacterium]|jgi:anti-sigma regulatory factor (Ser/Thr protein kinase)|nr:hypothetical protein [Pseudomonadota bacterium]
MKRQTTTPAVPILDFSVLDGLAFAAERGRLDAERVPRLEARGIGPLLELHHLAGTKLLPKPEAAPWIALGTLDSFALALNSPMLHRQWICPHTRSRGFQRTLIPPGDTTAWTGFTLRVQQAAAGAGFPRAIAAQLAATVGELSSNIYEHSHAAETGVVAFQVHTGRFELVVCDLGIGVCDSLRSAGEYRHLTDDGEALRLALSDGTSRFGTLSGRGHGFRPIFIGLANLNGALRFRSGDHGLLMDGRNPALVSARIAQKPKIGGFFASITCEL